MIAAIVKRTARAWRVGVGVLAGLLVGFSALTLRANHIVDVGETQAANTAYVIDYVHGNPTPSVDTNPMLIKLATDLRANYEADGTVADFVGDPASFSGLEEILGRSPFEPSTVCSDCGRLTPTFSELVDSGDAAAFLSSAPGPHPFRPNGIAVVLISLLGFEVFMALWMWRVVRQQATLANRDWRSINFGSFPSQRHRLFVMAPLYFLVIDKLIGRTDQKFRQTLQDKGLLEAHDQAILLLSKLRSGKTMTPDDHATAETLEAALADLQQMVDEYQPGANESDLSRRELQTEAIRAIERLTEATQAHRQANQEISSL